MNNQQINSELKNASPRFFLTHIPKEVTHDTFFIFSDSIDNQFRKNCLFLASEETISEKDLLNWKKDDFLIVAQTIDGDYIAGMTNRTLVIPSSLYKVDIEQYPLCLYDFFLSYYAKKIQSKILPSV